MSDKSLPFTKQFIEEVIQTFETPFYLYDEGAIRRTRVTCSTVSRASLVFRSISQSKPCPIPI